MNKLTIPLRYTRRKWLRTLMLLVVFSIAVASIVSLHYVSTVVGDSLEKKLTSFGANILVTPKSDTLSVSYGGFTLGDLLVDVQYLDESEITKSIQSIELNKNISAIAPKLVIMTTIHDKQVGVVGVRWQQERAIKSYWGVQGAYPAKSNEVLVGSKVARVFSLEPGQTISIKGSKALITGVVAETGSDDDNVILADIEFVQELAGKPGAINFVEVAALCAGCPIEEIVEQIQGKLQGVEIIALQNVVKQRMYSVSFVKQLILTVSIVILITACSMIGLSMLSAVNERKKEIGILRSLGYTKGDIFFIFSTESMVIGLFSGLCGYLAGYLLSLKVLDVIEILDVAVPPMSSIDLAFTSLFIAFVSVLSSSFPAWKASKIQPSEALLSL